MMLVAVTLLLLGGVTALRFGGAAIRIPVAAAALCTFAAVCFSGVVGRDCGGEFFDRLSAIFLLPSAVVGSAAAFFCGRDTSRKFCFFFCWTLAVILLLPLLGNPLAFLVFWEFLGLFSFGMLLSGWRHGDAPKAAWIYLLACQTGGLLLMMFLVLNGKLPPESAWFTLFLLALAAFGLKAGIAPLHGGLLPEASPAVHPAASALMSGAMANLGLYGILRFGTRLDFVMPEMASVLPALVQSQVYGTVLLLFGMLGAFGGVLFALAQNDPRRLLAYSSIENIGIMLIGLGLGFLGSALGEPSMAIFGFAGAFLHLFNHALLKSGLFMATGALIRACGVESIDRMGGLFKRLPQTGTLYLFSAIGISGVPPFNGFLGELLIYLAAFTGIIHGTGAVFGLSLAAVLVLAGAGALAMAVFVKSAGGMLFGEPRSPEAANPKTECGREIFAMTIPVVLSVMLITLSGFVVQFFAPVIAAFSVWKTEAVEAELLRAAQILGNVGACSAVVIVFTLLFYIYFRRKYGTGENGITWDCGYAEPTARMEYTGSAFVQPLTDFFRGILRPAERSAAVDGLFPKRASFHSETEDGAEHWLWRPLFTWTAKTADRVHLLQSGYLHLYILFMVLALLAMLIWGFCFAGTEAVK